jgi:RNA recognition motif-containing protein
MTSSTRIFIRSLPYRVSKEQFTKYFETFGKVVESSLPVDKMTGSGRGFGFIQYADESVACSVTKRDDLELGGRKLFAEIAKSEGFSQPFSRNEEPHILQSQDCGHGVFSSVAPIWRSQSSSFKTSDNFNPMRKHDQISSTQEDEPKF